MSTGCYKDYMTATQQPRRTYRPEEGILHSYPDTYRTGVTPSGTAKPIRYGDRIFVRLMMGGRTLMNCMINTVNDLTELYGEIRHQLQGLKGLCTLSLRNATRGWIMERPLKLYGQTSAPAHTPTTSVSAGYTTTARSPRSYQRAGAMAFPWETH